MACLPRGRGAAWEGRELKGRWKRRGPPPGSTSIFLVGKGLQEAPAGVHSGQRGGGPGKGQDVVPSLASSLAVTTKTPDINLVEQGAGVGGGGQWGIF